MNSLVIMGGAYPSGDEYNFNQVPASSKYVVENWPTPMQFVGFEIGDTVITSGNTAASAVVKYCYQHYAAADGGTRSSWDPLTVLAAVRDPAQYWGIVTTGSNTVASWGSNAWVAVPDKDQEYLTKSKSDSEMAGVLQVLLDQAPAITPN